MEERKRQRFDVAGSTSVESTDCEQNTFIDLGGELPTNLYFTICDDELSNESQDFLAIDNDIATHIKQEHNEFSKTGNSVQYIISQQSRNENTTVSPAGVTLHSETPTETTILPTTTAVHLPSGCEIFLVKEYVQTGNGDVIISEKNSNKSRSVVKKNVATATTSTASIPTMTNIKLEPGVPCITPKQENKTLQATAGSVATSYKKRDDKRRATHNEVERRRRDKINNWIFKLKEMLPKDMPNTTSALKPKCASNRNTSNNITSRLPVGVAAAPFTVEQRQLQQRTGNHCRSPPSDSKSQILIKACEYIKAMQEEMKSLRECLMENEKLRSSNQRLQCELQRLKDAERRRVNQQQHYFSSATDEIQLSLSTDSDNNPIETLNNNSSLFSATTPSTAASITLIGSGKTQISVPFTKRELIITDYVD